VREGGRVAGVLVQHGVQRHVGVGGWVVFIWDGLWFCWTNAC
jgi:hypothetical protein